MKMVMFNQELWYVIDEYEDGELLLESIWIGGLGRCLVGKKHVKYLGP